MTPKKLLVDGVRIAVCGLAMWVVLRGVSLSDEVILADGSQPLKGQVTLRDGEVLVTSVGGGTKALPLADIAVDENGDPRITYGFKTSWRESRSEFLLAAILAFSIVPFLQAHRIRTLLTAQEIFIGYWDALKLSFTGNFLNFAAPLGSTAGDVFKAYYFSLHTKRKTEAMTTVFLDRIIGLGTLVLVVSMVTILSPAASRLAPLRTYMVVMLAVGALGLIVYLAPPLRRLAVWKRIIDRTPFSEQLHRIDATAVRLVGRGRILGGAILTTVVLQAIAALSFFFVALALGMSARAGNAVEYYAYFSTGELVKALPGPPQGLGTMEMAYGYFFAPFGSASQILCAAFAIRIVMLICALPGLLVTMTGAYRPAVQMEPRPASLAAVQAGRLCDAA